MEQRKKNKVVLIITMIIALVGSIAIIVGIRIFNSPKNLTIATIDTLFKTIYKPNGELSTLSATIIDKNKKLFDLLGSSNVSLEDDINYSMAEYNIKANLKYSENKGSKLSNGTLSLMENNKSLGNISMYINNNKLFFKLDNSLSNYYFIDTNYVNLFKSITVNDIDRLRLILITVLKNDLKDKDFIKEKTNISIDNNDVSVTKSSITINKDRMSALLYDFYYLIANDPVLSSDLSNYLNLGNVKLGDYFANKLEEFKYSAYEEMTFTIYIRGYNEVVLTSVDLNNEYFNLYTYDNKIELVYGINNQDNSTVLSFLSVRNGNIRDITIKENSSIIASGTLEEEDTKLYLKLKIGNDYSIDLTNDLFESVIGNKYVMNTDLIFKTLNEETFKINNKLVITQADNIDLTPIKDAVSLEKITVEDYNNLNNNKIFKVYENFITMFAGYFNNTQIVG